MRRSGQVRFLLLRLVVVVVVVVAVVLRLRPRLRLRLRQQHRLLQLRLLLRLLQLVLLLLSPAESSVGAGMAPPRLALDMEHALQRPARHVDGGFATHKTPAAEHQEIKPSASALASSLVRHGLSLRRLTCSPM